MASCRLVCGGGSIAKKVFLDHLADGSRIERRFVRPQNVRASSLLRVSFSTENYKEDAPFLRQIEETVQKVLQAFPENTNISDVDHREREALGVARRLDAIIKQSCKDDDCPRCWFKRSLCICPQCPPLEKPQDESVLSYPSLPERLHAKINRIFLVMHHQEVCLMVDTSKLILASFPRTCRLVVAGIGPGFQNSMKEMYQAMGFDEHGNTLKERARKCLVLFPAEDSKTFADIEHDSYNNDVGWDLIVLDGTWPQARRLHNRYIPSEELGGPQRVKLRSGDLDSLGCSTSGPDNNLNSCGRQLRKHPIKWKEIGTLEATRLLLRDILKDEVTNKAHPHIWDTIAEYQLVANAAARRHRGR